MLAVEIPSIEHTDEPNAEMPSRAWADSAGEPTKPASARRPRATISQRHRIIAPFGVQTLPRGRRWRAINAIPLVKTTAENASLPSRPGPGANPVSRLLGTSRPPPLPVPESTIVLPTAAARNRDELGATRTT